MKDHNKKMLIQKFAGLLLLLLSLVIYIISKDTPDNDCTGLMLTVPIGLWMLLSRNLLI